MRFRKERKRDAFVPFQATVLYEEAHFLFRLLVSPDVCSPKLIMSSVSDVNDLAFSLHSGIWAAR